MPISSTIRERPSADRISIWLSILLAVIASTTSAVGQSVSLTQVVKQADPTLRWVVPAAMPYGTTLGSNQLTATAAVPGTFHYMPVAGTLPIPGILPLSVTFTPADPGYRNASLTVDLTVTSPGSSSFRIALANPEVRTYLVSPTQDTTILLTVSPVGDFHQPVALTCPTSTVLTCAIAPAVVRPTKGPVQVTLILRGVQIAHNQIHSASGSPALDADLKPQRSILERPPSRRIPNAPPVLACAALLGWFGMRRKLTSHFRRILWLALIAALLPVGGATLGCGSRVDSVDVTVTGSSLVESHTLSIAIRIPPQ